MTCKNSSKRAAFGMVMPERSFSNEKYRWGFNGKEMDNEVSGDGNNIDFGSRIYESRLGSWFSVDPLFYLSPSWSPYKGFNDNPNVYIDGDGRKEFLTIVMKDADGHSMAFRKQISLDIMTDGVKQQVDDKLFSNTPTACWHYENNYYDFERVVTVTANSDGTSSVIESTNILYENGTKDADDVWFGGKDRGVTKTDWRAKYEGFASGGNQKSGFHLVVDAGGYDPTKQRATEGDVQTINIGPLLDALGAATKARGQLPNIKEALGEAEFLNTIKDITESAQSIIDDSPNAGNSRNYCPNCSDPSSGQYSAPHGTDTVQKDANGNVTKDTRIKKP